MMTRRAVYRLLAPLLLVAALAPIVRPQPAVAASATVRVKGLKTTWTLSLLSIRSMDRIPHTSWAAYKRNFYRFFVLTIRLTNTGRRTEAPYDDLMLTMKVMPPYVTVYTAGFTVLPRDQRIFADMARAAAHTYGGALPWQSTQPGHTTTYCYVIGTNRGDAHYGLYNVIFGKPYVFLMETGM